jgi:hypothetical protein
MTQNRHVYDNYFPRYNFLIFDTFHPDTLYKTALNLILYFKNYFLRVPYVCLTITRVTKGKKWDRLPCRYILCVRPHKKTRADVLSIFWNGSEFCRQMPQKVLTKYNVQYIGLSQKTCILKVYAISIVTY